MSNFLFGHCPEETRVGSFDNSYFLLKKTSRFRKQRCLGHLFKAVISNFYFRRDDKCLQSSCHLGGRGIVTTHAHTHSESRALPPAPSQGALNCAHKLGPSTQRGIVASTHRARKAPAPKGAYARGNMHWKGKGGKCGAKLEVCPIGYVNRKWHIKVNASNRREKEIFRRSSKFKCEIIDLWKLQYLSFREDGYCQMAGGQIISREKGGLDAGFCNRGGIKMVGV